MSKKTFVRSRVAAVALSAMLAGGGIAPVVLPVAQAWAEDTPKTAEQLASEAGTALRTALETSSDDGVPLVVDATLSSDVTIGHASQTPGTRYFRITSGKTLKVTSGTISAGTKGTVVIETTGGTATIDGTTDTNPVLTVPSNGTLILTSGVVVKGQISVANGGTLIMESGSQVVLPDDATPKVAVTSFGTLDIRPGASIAVGKGATGAITAASGKLGISGATISSTSAISGHTLVSVASGVTGLGSTTVPVSIENATFSTTALSPLKTTAGPATLSVAANTNLSGSTRITLSMPATKDNSGKAEDSITGVAVSATDGTLNIGSGVTLSASGSVKVNALSVSGGTVNVGLATDSSGPSVGSSGDAISATSGTLNVFKGTVSGGSGAAGICADGGAVNVKGGDVTGAYSISIPKDKPTGAVTVSDDARLSASTAFYRGRTSGSGSAGITVSGGYIGGSKIAVSDNQNTYSGTKITLTGGTFPTDPDGVRDAKGFLTIDPDNSLYLTMGIATSGAKLYGVPAGNGRYVLATSEATTALKNLASMWTAGTLRVVVSVDGNGIPTAKVYEVGASNTNGTEVKQGEGCLITISGGTVTVTGMGGYTGTVTCSSAPGSYMGTKAATSTGGGSSSGSSSSGSQSGDTTDDDAKTDDGNTDTTPKAKSYTIVYGTKTMELTVDKAAALPDGHWKTTADKVITSKAALDALVAKDGDVIVLVPATDAEWQAATGGSGSQGGEGQQGGDNQGGSGEGQGGQQGGDSQGGSGEGQGGQQGGDPAGPTRPGDDPSLRPTGDRPDGWSAENGIWYLYEAGQPANGWRKSGGAWYYLRAGVMQAGWLKDPADGSWYLLSTVHDGSYGAMRTGWQLSGGKWFYLRWDGVMLRDATTPDGYYVGHDGAWIA